MNSHLLLCGEVFNHVGSESRLDGRNVFRAASSLQERDTHSVGGAGDRPAVCQQWSYARRPADGAVDSGADDVRAALNRGGGVALDAAETQEKRTCPRMKDYSARRGLKVVTWALMLTPALLLLVFFTLAVHVRIGLGHWPTSMVENYHATAYVMHERAFLWIGCFTVWGAIPLWLVLVCIQRFRPLWSWKLHLVQAATYAAGWGAIAAYTAWDPCQFVAWFLD